MQSRILTRRCLRELTMTNEDAKKFAKNMTYKEAINNVLSARCVPNRKATKIKLLDLLEILEVLDRPVCDVRDDDVCEDPDSIESEYTQKEIAKDFIDDVKSVEDFLPKELLPIGTKPYYIQAGERIDELAGAISRYSGYCKERTQSIRMWATEILAQCDAIESLNQIYKEPRI
jgi:hypothetical protein